ncbi:transketolase [Solibacillus sp. MA9]|uniref:Transketolase n=1 Tax=Solibacillus palustris TaxID=2908203 RepID=A0ABS9UAB4_9BACL|nr:transketolase [Solibacillus sp. MA9]MCH7321275.1 transketolase [Solibacillus sp. MA9]
MEQEIIEIIEKEVEQALFTCIDLKIEENYIAMGQEFAKILAQLQKHDFISPTLKVIVEPESCLTETRILLESLQEAQRRHTSRGKLLTHRQILNVWLRKNVHYQREILPGSF